MAGRKALINDWLTEDNLLRIEGWARDGFTEKQIANNKMGISEFTLSRWKKENELLRDAIKRGKAPADTLVENQMYKRATGYTTVETIEEIYEEDGVQRKHVRRITKEIPPDVTAQIFWLKNRKPAYWRDRREAEIAAKEQVKVILDV